ncbi:MAG: Sapep family Mn(2+)-dependent dipeptidase, partial [Eubacterium sp.]|nr:Sapep family Mn(2+)-dependent dipeptidase [Candidatus Colimonas fimequi]
MDLLTRVNEQIEANKTEMLASLSTLIQIPSVAVKTPGDKPFGEEVHRAFMTCLKMGEDAGFKTFNLDNYGGHIDFPAKADGLKEIVGILGHVDVVPEGDGWDFPAYSGVITEDAVLGRGTTDDKGPIIACLYAMKALKECGYEPKRTIRMILGLDEETNWEGMHYYVDNMGELPDYGFTPDADFPAIHGEKGILIFDIAKRFTGITEKGLELSSIKGGTAANSVANSARAVIHDTSGNGYEDIKNLVALYRDEKDCKINCRGVGKSFEITVKGVSAHGATPEKGVNAISLIMEFLGRLNFANDDVNDFLGFYNDCIGFDLHGERIGCEFSDEPSGKLVWNVGKIEMDKKSVQLTINVRYPVTLNDEAVYTGIMSVIDKYGLGIMKGQ